MPAPPKGSRPPEDRCGFEKGDGSTCGAYRCKSLSDDPKRLVTTTERCYWHQPHRVSVAEVVPIRQQQQAAEQAHADGRMTREELMGLHESIARGQVTETKQTSEGKLYQYCALKDRQTSLDKIARLNGWYEDDGEREEANRTRIVIPDNNRGVATHPAMKGE